MDLHNSVFWALLSRFLDLPTLSAVFFYSIAALRAIESAA